VQKSLLELLAFAINGNELTMPVLSTGEWHSLFKEAKDHGVHLLITYSLKKKSLVFGDENLTKAYNDLLYITMLYHASSISIIDKFLDKIEQKGIEIMVLKGYYFQSLYPYPALRIMGDVDFFVKHEDLNQIDEILRELCYTKYKESDSDTHHIYFHPNYIMIEIHFAILNKFFDDEQKAFEATVWNERVIKNIKGRLCKVPSEVNHAIYCCLHMMSHLRSSGFGLRHLCDLIFIINRDLSFNWNEFLAKARMLRVFNFVSSILWICHTYLKFEIPEIYLQSIKPSNLSKVHVLMEKILRSGEYGLKDKAYVMNKTLAEYQLNKKFNKVNSPLSLIFPSKHNLSEAYSYAKDNLLLLPVAWIHRIILYLIRTDSKLIEKIPNKVAINQHKDLIKWFSQG
jgi:hypothetical protein